jgi:hypothetical protein
VAFATPPKSVVPVAGTTYPPGTTFRGQIECAPDPHVHPFWRFYEQPNLDESIGPSDAGTAFEFLSRGLLVINVPGNFVVRSACLTVIPVEDPGGPVIQAGQAQDTAFSVALSPEMRLCSSAGGTRLSPVARGAEPGRVGARTADATDSCPFHHHPMKHEFANCRQLAAYIASHKDDPLGLPEARSQYVPIAKWTSKRLYGVVRVTLQFGLDPKQSYVATPSFTWPNMSMAEHSALHAALRNLAAHEHGHLIIANQDVTRGRGLLATKRASSGNAKNRRFFDVPNGTDRNHVNAEVKRRLEELAAEIQEDQEDYDAITNHGATQSAGPAHGFPGGADATFTCP